MVDKLRIVRLENIKLPIGTPVDFEGQEIGRVIRSDREDICEIAINSDIALQAFRSGKISYSLEVVRV